MSIQIDGELTITVDGRATRVAIGGITVPPQPDPDPPPAGDRTPPRVVSFSPASSASNVPATSAITVTFTEPISQDSAAGIGVFNQQTGVPVPCGTSVDGSRVILRPKQVLADGTIYEVRVGSASPGAPAVRDLSGNLLVEYAVSRFTTIPVANPPTPPAARSLNELLQVMVTKPHVAKLDGVPDGYDWAFKPRPGTMNAPRGSLYMTAWGQCYTSGGPLPENVGIEIANLKGCQLTGSGVWKVLQDCVSRGSQGIDGAMYPGAFGGNNASKPGTSKTPSGTLIGRPDPAWNIHFYPQGRGQLDGGGVAGLISSFDVRFVKLNPNGPDYRAQAKAVAGAGGDYWASASNPYPPNGDWIIGHHAWITPEWTTVLVHTLSAQQLADIASGKLAAPPVTVAGDGGGSTTTPPTPSQPTTTGSWTRPSGTLKLMALGDSITAGQAEDSAGLASMVPKLAAAGFPVHPVGSLGGSNGFRHEGHGAWCADDEGGRCIHANGFKAEGMRQKAGGFVTQFQPDVVVLNIGSNDRYVQQGWGDDRIAVAVGQVIDAIHSAKPDCLVFVTGLKSWGETVGRSSDNAKLNPLIRGEAEKRAAAGKPVVYFDAYALINDGKDFTGEWSIHPSSQGNRKMSEATFAALTERISAAPVR